jgi:hypothetical protein
MKTQHDSTLPPNPLQQMRNIRSQRANARATAPSLPSPAHHMATMAKASVTSARALNPSPVDALFECYLEWKDASSEVWQAYARWRQALSGDRLHAFVAYSEALATEEQASKGYAMLLAAATDRRDRQGSSRARM